MTATGQRLDLDEQRGHPIAHILVINDLTMTRSEGDGRSHLANQLLAGFVHANYWKTRIAREAIHFKNVLHRSDKRRVLIGRDLPIFTQMRLQFVFFNDR